MLGKGIFAEVRAAIQRFTNKNVAVKILKKSSMTEKQVDRARYEIETLKLCQHPNIMKLYDVFENADYIYLVLESLSGGNLYEFLKEKNFSLSEHAACKIVYSVAHALNYLHAFGIIHRDIKPDNIVLVTPDENSDVKLVDFGLAKIFSPTS